MKSRFDCRFHSFLSIRPGKLINVKISDGVPPMESMFQERVSYFYFTVIKYIDIGSFLRRGWELMAAVRKSLVSGARC